MPLRVLHCPTNVGNHPQGLARAERQLGLASWCVDLETSWLGYEVDERSDRSATGSIAFEARRWHLLLRALRDYDVVHFNFGRSLLPAAAPSLLGEGDWRRAALHLPGRLYARCLALRDLPLLRRAGKVVAVTFQGDDARQASGPDASERHRGLHRELEGGYYTERGDALKRSAIAAWSRYADLIFYLNPDLGSFLPARAEFVAYAHVDPAGWTPIAMEPSATPRIVHAPSHRGIKGTRHVVDAVRQLRHDGVDVDLDLVEGVRHAEAREFYEQADVVVDQLLVGWYGGLAVEAMALGKPVVCFVDEELAARYAPPALVRDLPLVRATREDLPAVLKDLLALEKTSRSELSRRGRAFVERWHDPVKIAASIRDRYLAVLEPQRTVS